MVDFGNNTEDLFSTDKIKETWKNVKTKHRDRIQSSICVKIEARHTNDVLSDLLRDKEIKALENELLV
jgi:hypothetical protein